MAIDVFCYAVDDNVGAVIERVLDIGAEEGVVYNDHNAVLVRYGCDVADIDQGECRVGRRFDPDKFRLVWSDQLCD